MTEPTPALNYMVEQLNKLISADDWISKSTIKAIIERARDIQHRKLVGVSKDDRTWGREGPVGDQLAGNAPKIVNGMGGDTGVGVAFEAQPNGCTSATPRPDACDFTSTALPKFKPGDRVLYAYKGHVHDGSQTFGTILKKVPRREWDTCDRYLIQWNLEIEDTYSRLEYTEDHLVLVPRQQPERDDWWTKRIDPYDDRIRVLERFMHRVEGKGPAGPL